MVYYGSSNQGPKAIPRKYIVRLTVNGQTQQQDFEILKDLRISTSPEEFQSQFDFLVKVRDKVSEANQSVIDIRKTRDDLTYLKNKIGVDEKYKDVADRIKKFEEELTIMENTIHQTKNKSVQDPLNYGIKINNRLAHLMVEQGQGDYPPTKQGEEVRQLLTKIVDEELIKVKTTIRSNLEVINRMVKEKGIEIVF